MANPSSSKTFTSLVPTGESPRGYYLQHPDEAEPTHIAHSSFIPTAMVEHLMRNKKDSAIAEKFKTDPHVYEDQITMIEGALHTFVTPIVPITTHGDYVWDIYHNTFTFGNRAGHQLARKAVMSGLVQQDFEKDNVMMQVCACGENEIIGTNVFPKMIDLHGKHKTETRQKYETQLRHYLVYHLTAAHKLPAAGKVKDMTKEEAMEWLAEIVQSPKPAADIPKLFRRRFFHHTYEHYYEGTTKNYVLSLEIIFNSALCYVYTFQPPSIFIRALGLYTGGTEFMSRIIIAAMKYFAATTPIPACKAIAWDVFNSETIFPLLQAAFAAKPEIAIRRRDQIIKTRKGEPRSKGLYRPPKGAKDAILVIHNNSDGFGQNIETEGAGGSLDGEVGEYCSAAASLLGDRKDLCDHLIAVD